ncbi:MAG TPA: GNAT family N-acetyltransferase [Phycisphaerales bacterium]|nr:GNAT family N-acetyltransferase [Phycisphaerales bacterium]
MSAPRSPEPADVNLRAIEPRDLPWVRAELVRNWHSTRISSLGVWHEADRLPGLIAGIPGDDTPAGLLTHTPITPGRPCEVITLSARIESRRVGTHLLGAFTNAARATGCSRVFLTTTNDNLRALAFYQKRGWTLVAVHRAAMDRARLRNPAIPLVGMNGIPLRDEIELEHAI